MSDSKNDFQELKRLLKLKQHEVPPPGYFNHFSGDVMARIRAGESAGPETALERIQSGSPFLATVLRLFEAKPGLIGAMATSLCLLFLIGVVLADRSDEPTGASGGQLSIQSPSSAPDSSPMLASAPLEPAESGIYVSTNPVSSLQPSASLFGSPQNPLFQPAAFMPAGH